jgi:toxin YoeB
MAKQIVWTKQAQQDRKDILDYWPVNNRSNAYSLKLNQLIKKAVNLIAAHPHIGRRTDVQKIRVKLIRNYLIFYEESKTKIFILTIWDNRRNPEEKPY